MVKKGSKAPDFCLKGIDENGKEGEFSLKNFKGKKVVFYFYPKDNTPGCTIEACDFRNNFKTLLKKGIIVLGASPDSINSHKKFQEKQGLNFTLLSDPDKKIADKYGAFGEKNLYGKVTKGIIRSTFLIDDNGKIEKAWHNVKAKGHVEEVLKSL